MKSVSQWKLQFSSFEHRNSKSWLQSKCLLVLQAKVQLFCVKRPWNGFHFSWIFHFCMWSIHCKFKTSFNQWKVLLSNSCEDLVGKREMISKHCPHFLKKYDDIFWQRTFWFEVFETLKNMVVRVLARIIMYFQK